MADTEQMMMIMMMKIAGSLLVYNTGLIHVSMWAVQTAGLTVFYVTSLLLFQSNNTLYTVHLVLIIYYQSNVIL